MNHALKKFDLHFNPNLGKSGAVIYAVDLTEACYVDYNKGNVNNSSTLGGEYARKADLH